MISLRLSFLLAVFWIASLSVAQNLRLRSGDVVRIVLTVNLRPSAGAASENFHPGAGAGTDDDPQPSQSSTSEPVNPGPDPYQGDFVVQTDGAIYGIGFGRLVVAGKTVQEAQALVRKAMRRLVQPSEVFVTLAGQHLDHVYVIGRSGTGGGIASWTKDLTLREIIATTTVDESADLIEVQVFRKGKKYQTRNLAALLKNGGQNVDVPLLPDDVVVLTPVSTVRVWVTGAVRSPGRISIQEGTSLYQALAQAGGVSLPNTPDAWMIQKEYRVELRRGDSKQDFPLDPGTTSSGPSLQAGDTISIVAPERRKVVVLGHVTTPGEYQVRAGVGVVTALALGGGVTSDGTASNVLVFRKGEVYVVDARVDSSMDKPNSFELEDGDVVAVQRNIRAVYVLGDVVRQGQVFLQDEKELHATDALALAGGLTPTGTLRRVYLARPGSNGKVAVTQFNLDEYIKSGKIAANPKVGPGDTLFFSNTPPTTLAAVGTIISSLLLVSATNGGRL